MSDHHGGPGQHAYGGHDKHAAHNKHAGHTIEMFRNRFWISLLLTIPTLVLGHGCNPYPKQRRVG